MDYKRVKLDDSGAEVTVGVVLDGMTVIDKPAVDKNGRPLRDKPKTTVAGAAAKRTAKKTTAQQQRAATTTAAPEATSTNPSGDTTASASEEDSK